MSETPSNPAIPQDLERFHPSRMAQYLDAKIRESNDPDFQILARCLKGLAMRVEHAELAANRKRFP